MQINVDKTILFFSPHLLAIYEYYIIAEQITGIYTKE